MITTPEADSKSMSRAESSKITIILNLYYQRNYVDDFCTQCAVVNLRNMINVLTQHTSFFKISA